jgi:hypothetical protein
MEMLEFACWFSPSLMGENAAKNAIATLLDIGATFVNLGDDLEWHPIINPYTLIDFQSNRFEIQHSLLEQETASVVLIPESGYLMLMTDANYIDNRINEEHAQALLKFAFNLYFLLKPIFCWVDGVGYDTPSEKEIAALSLRKIMWANFYGPEYVRKYGREFLLNAPGWKKEELNDGGIAYVISPRYLNRTEVVSSREIATYFKSKTKVKVYKPASFGQQSTGVVTPS